MSSKITLTKFEWSVLKATMLIPLGRTRTYKWVAQKIGRPRAVRAVGHALRKNPYPLMIPCHRVVKSDGTLGAYAGKMDGQKRRLLEVERSIVKAMANISSKKTFYCLMIWFMAGVFTLNSNTALPETPTETSNPLPVPATHLWDLTEGFSYSVGKFGSDDVTKDYEYDSTIRRYFKYGDISTTIPYLKQRSPRDVLVSTTSGQVTTQDLDTSKRVSDGIGDVTLDGTWYFLKQNTNILFSKNPSPLDLNFYAHIKFPSASSRKALGTHQFDGGPGFGVRKLFFDKLSLFSDVTYTVTGNIKGSALQNVLYSGSGAGYDLTSKLNLSVTYEISNAESKGTSDPNDISNRLTYKINDRISVYSSFAVGLSTGSPRQSYNVGITIGF